MRCKKYYSKKEIYALNSFLLISSLLNSFLKILLRDSSILFKKFQT